MITASKKAAFYKRIRTDFFQGKLAQSQVEGIESILEEWNASGLQDLRQLGYTLGTVYHETAKTMQAIEEYGKGNKYAYGKPHPVTGQIYFGRGYPQLTWYQNYLTFEKLLGIPLTTQPELMLDEKVSAKVLILGMSRGLYTGKKLSDYFNDKKEDWVNARRIVNGMDKAELIAGYGRKFYDALKPVV